MKPRSITLKFFAATIAFAGTTALQTTSALAHIQVSPSNVTSGRSAIVSFRVPNERSATSTNKVELVFPTEHPLVNVKTEPMAGWTISVETTKLTTPIKTSDGQLDSAVSKITWSGGTIGPDQYQIFNVLARFPSDTNSIKIGAIQTYSDGEVVRWIEDELPNGQEPEYPAPVITISAASSGTSTDSSTSTTVADSHDHGSTETTKSTAKATDSTARNLAWGAIGVGAAALLAALIGIAKKAKS